MTLKYSTVPVTNSMIKIPNKTSFLNATRSRLSDSLSQEMHFSCCWMWFKETEMDSIIAGTLPKLVERLTYEKYPGSFKLFIYYQLFQCRHKLLDILPVDIQVVILLQWSHWCNTVHRTFVTPHELLDLLIMRYHIPPPVNNTPDLLEKFKLKKETPIQLR